MPLCFYRLCVLDGAQSTLYATHLKGFTILHPEVTPGLRGGFAGMAHREIIGYLKALGISSIELLPVQSFISERNGLLLSPCSALCQIV